CGGAHRRLGVLAGSRVASRPGRPGASTVRVTWLAVTSSRNRVWGQHAVSAAQRAATVATVPGPGGRTSRAGALVGSTAVAAAAATGRHWLIRLASAPGSSEQPSGPGPEEA